MGTSPARTFSPIFVTGVARSGTTWLFDLLRKHPKAIGWFESRVFTPQGLGQLFGPNHWGGDPSRPPGLGRYISRERLVESVRELVFSWIDQQAEVDHSFWVEKSPGEIDFDMIDELFPDARFVHAVRDGRDVALSIRAASRSWAPAWRQGFGRTMVHTAHHWAKGIDRGFQAAQRFGDRWLDVRFEDVRADPEGQVKRMWEHCGLTHDEDLARAVLDNADIEKLIEQGEAGGESTFRRRGAVGEWREEFGAVDRLLFAAVAGEQLKRLGYSDRRWFS